MEISRDFVELERRPSIAEFRTGDTIRVSAKVVEGDRERIQVFEGVVIKQRRAGTSTSFTVRRIAHNVGVERTFLLHSPRVDKVDVVRYGKVRRSRLFYLRGLTGKAARIKERPRAEQKARAAKA